MICGDDADVDGRSERGGTGPLTSGGIVRTIYVDHSIVTHEQWWPHLEQAVASRELRLALSVWNLFEIGIAADQAQQEKRLAFLEGLKPLWVVERRAVQRQEVERFLWQHKLGVSPKELLVTTPSLSVVDSFFLGRETRIGLTLRQLIRGIDYAQLLPLKKLSPRALATLQMTDRKVLVEKQKEIFLAWIGPSIPEHDPDGRAFTVSQKADFLNFCHQHQAQFLAECRSLAVEDALTAARARDARRNPKESDGLDLQHAAMALPYCDVFFTRDRYQGMCAEAARTSLATLDLAALCTTPEELATI